MTEKNQINSGSKEHNEWMNENRMEPEDGALEIIQSKEDRE